MITATKTTYGGYQIETYYEGTNNERSHAFLNSTPVLSCQSDMNKFNSVEKVKAKIDQIRKAS